MIEEYMEQYADIKAKIKELKAEQEELRTTILTNLKINDLTEATSETCTLRLVTQIRNSFNKSLALEKLEEHGEDPSAFLEPSEFEILKINRHGGN